MSSTHTHDVFADDEDDDYEPPPPVRSDAPFSSTCPSCGKDMKKHGALDLLRCAEAVESTHEGDEDYEPVYGHRVPVGTMVERPPLHGPPVPPLTEFERWVRKGRPAPDPTPEQLLKAAHDRGEHASALVTGCADCDAEAEAIVAEARQAAQPHVLDPDWTPTAPPPAEAFDVTAPIEQVDYLAPLPPVAITTADGVLDLEQLALAMRNVVLRERDDVIKRGGPLERQNLELKERLAGQIEQTKIWRDRADAAVRERNSYKDQLDAKIKETRQRRAKQDRSGEGAKAVREIKEIIKIVNRLDGWTVKMQGNGHYRFEKDGVFITDAASSGGSQQVNMATVVKLRKAGVKV